MSQNQNTNSNQSNNQETLYGEPVFVYTSDQAVEDGILFDITAVNPEWKKGLFNYVTVNLLNNGYLNKEDKIKDILHLLINNFPFHNFDKWNSCRIFWNCHGCLVLFPILPH